MDVGLEDMIGLVDAAGDSPFARLRTRAKGKPVVASGALGVGQGADALVHDTLLVFWTTTDLATLTTVREAMPLLVLVLGESAGARRLEPLPLDPSFCAELVRETLYPMVVFSRVCTEQISFV